MDTTYDLFATRFKALAHPVRQRILEILRCDEACVCHLEAAIDKRQAYISQQLMVLRQMGIVASRKQGLQVFYRLDDEMTARLLEAAFGPVTEAGLTRLEHCTCPHCAVSVQDAP